MDPDENTLGADLLSDPKARVLRKSRVMEMIRYFIVYIEVYLLSHQEESQLIIYAH